MDGTPNTNSQLEQTPLRPVQCGLRRQQPRGRGCRCPVSDCVAGAGEAWHAWQLPWEVRQTPDPTRLSPRSRQHHSAQQTDDSPCSIKRHVRLPLGSPRAAVPSPARGLSPSTQLSPHDWLSASPGARSEPAAGGRRPGKQLYESLVFSRSAPDSHCASPSGATLCRLGVPAVMREPRRR